MYPLKSGDTMRPKDPAEPINPMESPCFADPNMYENEDIRTAPAIGLAMLHTRISVARSVEKLGCISHSAPMRHPIACMNKLIQHR